MKKVNKNMTSRPVSLCFGRHYYDTAINELGTQKRWPTNSSGIYKSDSVKNNLDLIYHGKCAFCNQIPKGSPLQVEHFRPKNGVMNEVHSGYYWLGYEWTNLLYACGNCNSKKNTNFPILPGGLRIICPTWINVNQFELNDCLITSSCLKNERHTLINPEIDNPEEHLFYEADGKIAHLDTRGEVSIRMYNLNRDELYLDGRKKILDSVIIKFAKRLKRYSDGNFTCKSTCSQIIDIIEEDILNPIYMKDSFDHFRYTIFKNFDIYITPRFPMNDHRNLLNIIFNRLNQDLSINLN